MMKKTLAIALALTIVLGATLTAFARASDYIDSYNITVAAMGDGKVRVSATVNATKPTMTTVGFPSVRLYENDGSGWKQVASYIDKFNPNAQSGSYGFDFDYQGTKGYKYYAWSNFYVAKSGEGSDLRDLTSATVTAS